MAVTLEEFKTYIVKMNKQNQIGPVIAQHFLNRKADRLIVLKAFRQLGFAAKAIGSRVYVSDGPWPTDRKLPKSNKEFRVTVSSILW